MSDINQTDEELLQILKKEITLKAGLEKLENWTQKDYDFLVFFIEEKSGIKISLTTIKRIWRNEYNRLPHISTLDALSSIVYGKDWLSLKLTGIAASDTLPHNKIKEATVKTPEKRLPLVWMALAGVIIVALLLVVFADKFFNKPIDPKQIMFSVKTSVTNQVPNTVVFSYNVDSLMAKKFYIQQSWDIRRRVEVQKGNHQQTDIYYLPGYYMAKLIADDSIIKEIPVHIKTSQWVIAAHQNNLENKIIPATEWLPNGDLGMEPAVLGQHKIDTHEPFNLTFHNSRDFGIDGNNFVFTADFRIDSTGIVCPLASLVLKGEHEFIYAGFGAKGCESDLNLSISNQKFNGKKVDLTAFGTDIYHWQKVKVLNKNQLVQIYLNEQKIFETTYTKPLGELKEIVFIFRGNGIARKPEIKAARS